MNWFPAAFGFTLGWEDPGVTGEISTDNNGAQVRWGLNAASWPGDPVFTLPLAESFWRAQQVYRTIWGRVGCGLLESRAVAMAVFDQSFNGGDQTGPRLLQQAIGTVKVDGFLGPETADAANKANPVSLVPLFVSRARSRYLALAAQDPSMTKYLSGWLARAASYGWA